MQENYQKFSNIRKISVGRSMHICIEGILIPQLCQIITCPENTIS